MRFGAFEVDLRSGEVYKHGIRLKLQDQPFQMLALLLEHSGDVVTREELRQKLWPADTFVDFDTGLKQRHQKLRDVLGDSAEEPATSRPCRAAAIASLRQSKTATCRPAVGKITCCESCSARTAPALWKKRRFVLAAGAQPSSWLPPSWRGALFPFGPR